MTLRLDIIVKGPLACFRRPEMTRDLISYDAISPPVAVRMFDSVHKEAGQRWCLERIGILKPIKLEWHESRSEEGHSRRVLALTNVAYHLAARLIVSDGRAFDGESLRDRLLASGTHPVHLGLKNMTGTLDVVATAEAPPAHETGIRDLGWMMLDFQHAKGAKHRYFHAVMRDGIIDLSDLATLTIVS